MDQQILSVSRQISHECVSGTTTFPRYLSVGCSSSKKPLDLLLRGMQFQGLFPIARTSLSTEGDALIPTTGQRFLRSLADEVPLYFGGQAESEGKHLALDVFTQTVIVLDSPDLAFLGHTKIKNLHYHKEITTKTRQFRTDDEIIFPDPLEKSA